MPLFIVADYFVKWPTLWYYPAGSTVAVPRAECLDGTMLDNPSLRSQDPQLQLSRIERVCTEQRTVEGTGMVDVPIGKLWHFGVRLQNVLQE